MIRLTCLRAQLSALVNANLFRWLVLLSLIFSCLNSPISSQQTGSKKNRFSETLASMILWNGQCEDDYQNLNSIDILLCLSVNNSMFFLWYCEGKAVNP